MLHTEYEHLMLHRQRQQQLESQPALRHSTALGASAGRRRTIRSLAHGLGTSLIAAGRMLQSL